MLAALAAAPGCTRRFYRDQADKEVDCVLTEKNRYDAWKIEEYHLPPDPRARFAASGRPDFPPMPPDDPAAKFLSPNPQKPGKAGVGNPDGTGYLELIAAWDAENRANQPPKDANTEAASTFGIGGPPVVAGQPFDKGLQSNERPFIINLDQACELALFNSREFQDRREELYLSALPVTLQRFAFTYQFFAIEELIRGTTGSETPAGKTNFWQANSSTGFSKLFPTGALLLFRFANQVVVNMAAKNGPRVVTPSNLSLDFVQPLLRGGGRAVTLEPLTQSERDLLYSIRGYARFRKEFFVSIAGGGDFGQIFSPIIQLALSGQAPTEGYLPTLLRAAQLDNEKQTLAVLEAIRALYRASLEGGDVSQLQLDQVELDLLSSQANVLQQTQQLQDAVDRFKQQLGVPISVPLQLDDAPMRPLKIQQARFLDIVNQFEEIRNLANRNEWIAEPEKLRERLLEQVRTAKLTDGTRFRSDFPKQWAALATQTDDQLEARSATLRAEKRDVLKIRTDAEMARKPAPPETGPRLEAIDRELELLELEKSMRRFLARAWERPGADPARVAAARASAFRDVVSDFAVVLGEARNERLEMVRERWPELPATKLEGVDLVGDDLDRSMALASQTALNNRFDLMNVRGRLVDVWRQIAVAANALFGVLDVRYTLNSATPLIGTQPFDFRGTRSSHQLVMTGELPLVRQAERNAYRATLIAFQRQRRNLQQAEDRILTDIRSELRQLRFLAENYKIQQRAVELAYYQVESSLNVLQAPPRVVPGGAGGGGGSGTGSDAGSAAALTQQLLNAVRSLLRAQNQLYSTYQNFLIVRLQLYRDLELMNLDRRGVWIDDDIRARTREGIRDPQRPVDGASEQLLPAPQPVPGAVPPPA